MQRIDHKLDCKACGTLYLELPEKLSDATLIKCSTCGAVLGRWADLELDFNQQGGQDGVFELKDGQILRKT